MSKYICRCGRNVDIIKSYFIKDGSRVTVCDGCADKYKLTHLRSEEYNPKLKNANNK